MSFKKGHKKIGGRKRWPYSKNALKGASLEYLEEIIERPDYKVRVAERLLAGEGGALEMYAWQRTYGKPREVVELQVTTPLFTLTKQPELGPAPLPPAPDGFADPDRAGLPGARVGALTLPSALEHPRGGTPRSGWAANAVSGRARAHASRGIPR
jgi:hypothetical protein